MRDGRLDRAVKTYKYRWDKDGRELRDARARILARLSHRLLDGVLLVVGGENDAHFCHRLLGGRTTHCLPIRP
jgi:hypothetical protein